MANLYCDVPRDVISYQRAILLASSPHWNLLDETQVACCFALKQFGDIINCSLDIKSIVINYLVIERNLRNSFFGIKFKKILFLQYFAPVLLFYDLLS